MRNFKHIWKVALAGAVLTGVFLINATSHRTTEAAVPPLAHTVATAEAIATTPINAVESSGGGDVSATNKTDW